MRRTTNPWARSAFTLGAVVLALAVFLGLRTLNAVGVFTTVTPGFAGTCSAITGINGPEDLQIDAPDGLVFISATNRRSKTPDPADGLYTMALNGPAALTRLAGTPHDFHPGGISLLRGADGSLTLMAINHQTSGLYSVEIFAVTVTNGAVKLAAGSSIAGGLLVHPNDIAAVSPSAFYVTNDSTVKNPGMRTFEDYALMRQGDVIYFDGNVFRLVARGLDFANGIQLSPDGGHLYVATTMGRALYTYTREPFTGALTDAHTLSISSGLDNIDVDAKGNLWVAGHPDLLGQARYRTDPSARAASQIFKVTLNNGVPQKAEPVYVNNGGQIGAASVGAIIGQRLLIGSALDDKVLDCRLK